MTRYRSERLPRRLLPRRPSLGALACIILMSCGDSGAGPEQAVASSIQLSHTELTIADGATATLTASVLDQHGRPIASDGLMWSTADASVATVDGTGQVSGRKQGQTRVTASIGRVSASVGVVVRPVAAALVLPSSDQLQGIIGVPLPIVVRVMDRHGLAASGIAVGFSAGSGGVSPGMVTTDAQGYARAAWTLAPGTAEQTVVVTVTVDGLAPVTLTARATTGSETLVSMLGGLENQIASAVIQVQESLPRNPHLATYIQTKVAMLQSPTLAGDIIGDRRWSEASATSGGRSVPIVAVFPLESMRAEAAQSTQTVASGLPILEDFIGVRFPRDDIRIWEGFVLGNTGGGGSLFMEDRATYEARTPSTRLPYEAILLHEVAHSYIGNESLTQFLELYQYNVLHTGSTNVASWIFTRSWIPSRDTNEGVHALLDVYQLIGRDAMAAAYRAVYPLHPPYGQPLSPEAIQAFVDQAPAALKTQVAAKVAMIRS